MPKLPEATRVERRQQLVDAAWRCVADRGFQNVTVDHVCAEAGVSKGAFYGYFEQKRDLLLALLDDEAAEVDAAMEELTHAPLSGVERLRGFARAMFDRADDEARVQIRADLWAEMSSDPVLRDRWLSVVRHRRTVLRTWIESSVASGELRSIPENALASILLALGDGLVLHAGLDPSGFRWTNVRRALDALLDGVSST